MNKQDLIAIRDVKPEDLPFIFSTWLKGLLFGGDAFYRKIPKALYFKNHHKVIEQILTRATVKVAVLREDSDVILGYSVTRSAGGVTLLDWVFVKERWRSIGIAKSLVPEKIDFATNLTRVGSSILEKNPKTLYNPYL